VADWWRGFFDDAYRFLYGDLLHPVRTEREVAAVCKLLGLGEGARLLDLCCGDGRHSVPLRRRGLEVCGVDSSEVLLRRAAERAARVLQGGDPHPRWIHADARALPLPSASFDGAVCLFNSIGYGTDDDTAAMFREAARVLRSGKGFLVECDHRARAEAAQVPREERELAVVRGVPVEVERWIDDGVQHAIFRWDEQGERRERRLRHRLYGAEEIESLLKAAGFSQVQSFGGYDGRPFSLDAPVLVAQGTR
jgi:ubiquinone/menaquinone biosynthesis C-methylase UbiE